MKRNRRVAGGLIALLLPVLFILRSADAHFPGVEVTVECVDVRATLRVLVVSWNTDEPDRRYNDRVRVDIDGTPIGEGQFLPSNEFAFTLTTTLPADGRTVTVRATAVNDFGPNHEHGFAGTFRETRATLPESCVPATTATTTTTTTTTTRPAVAPNTTAAPPAVVERPAPTTIPTQVQGETLTRLPDAQVAQPVVVQPSFTG